MKKQIDRNNELDIRIEKGLCSTLGQKRWDLVAEEIEEVAKELGLSKQEKEALIQRQMASLRYAELKAENIYLSRTEEVTAVRKINKNKLEMQRMSRIYANNTEAVKESEPVLKQKVADKQIFENTRPKEKSKTQTQKN